MKVIEENTRNSLSNFFTIVLSVLLVSDVSAAELQYWVCEVVRDGYTSPVEGKIYPQAYAGDAGPLVRCPDECRGQRGVSNEPNYRHGSVTRCKRYSGKPPKFGDYHYPEGKAVGYRCNLELRQQDGMDCPNDSKIFLCDMEKDSGCDARPALTQCEVECDCGNPLSAGHCEKISYDDIQNNCPNEIRRYVDAKSYYMLVEKKYNWAVESVKRAQEAYEITCGVNWPPKKDERDMSGKYFCIALYYEDLEPVQEKMRELEDALKSAEKSRTSAHNAYTSCIQTILEEPF